MHAPATPPPARIRALRLVRNTVTAAVVGALAVGFGVLPGLAPGSASAATTVNGGGSSFAAPEIGQWAADTARNPYNLSVNYVTSSSGSGRDEYAQGLYDFGATDIVYNLEDGNYAQQAAAQHPYKYVTVSAGGLAFQYNLNIGGVQFNGLNLTSSEVCGIFTGEITTWNQLAQTTGDALLASDTQPIHVVVRSDQAGESYVLSQYCQAVDPSGWQQFRTWVDANQYTISYSDPNMAKGLPVSTWPGTLINGDQQVQSVSGATAAAQTVNNPSGGQNSITYEATAYAQQLGAPVASVENAANVFIQPGPTSVQVALSYAHPNALGTFDLNFNGPSPAAYFPSTYSYILDPTTTKTPDSGVNSPLNEFLCFAVGQGQQQASSLLYAPLSQQVTALSIDAIEATPGAPSKAQCGSGGPSPVVTKGKPPPSSGGGGTTTGKPRPPVAAGGSPGSPGSSGGTGTGGTTGTGTGGTTGTGGSGSGSSGSSGTGTGGTTTRTRSGKTGRSGSGTGTATGTGAGTGAGTGPGTGTGTGTGTGAGGGAGTVTPGAATAAAATGPASPGADNAPLWWVLAGVILAAAVSAGIGATRKGAA